MPRRKSPGNQTSDYWAMFPPGTRTILEPALRQSVNEPEIRFADDSAIRFTTRTRLTQASQLPFANNVFRVLGSVPRANLNRSLRQLVARIESLPFASQQGEVRGFRTMVHIDGALKPIDPGLRDELNHAIAARTGAKLQSRGSGTEYWVIGRTALQELVLAERLPKRQEVATSKGALSPQIATMLVLASVPRPEDRFLDPFMGSGAILAARLAHPFRALTGSDLHLALTSVVGRKVRNDRRVTTRREDARDLTSVDDHSIDVIVTDPPWGEFRNEIPDFERFAADVARSFDRVLEPERGHFVVLMTRRRSDQFVTALRGTNFRIHATHGILVNGHPATVIVGSR